MFSSPSVTIRDDNTNNELVAFSGFGSKQTHRGSHRLLDLITASARIIQQTFEREGERGRQKELLAYTCDPIIAALALGEDQPNQTNEYAWHSGY